MNLEFQQMMHGGTLGIPYLKNMMDSIDTGKVKEVFNLLKVHNPKLKHLEVP